MHKGKTWVISRSRTVLAICGTILLLGTVTTVAGAARTHSQAANKKNPIVLAGICDYTGPAPSPQSCQMAQDYFKWLDARGGINGHQVEYYPMDGADSAATQSQDGARAVLQLHVDAIVGDYSSYACTVNASLYAQYKVYDLGGPEGDVGCWKSPYIRPMNGGPYVNDAIDIYYFTHYRSFKRICVLASTATPDSLADTNNVIAVMKKITGVQDIYSIPYAPGTSITPAASAAVADNCQGFLIPTTEPEGESLWRALSSLGATKHMVMLDGVLYSTMAQQLGSEGDGLLAGNSIVPYWNDNSKALQEYHMLLKKYSMPAGSFNEYGFLSALLFTELVSAIKGPLNRTTIGKALRGMKNANGFGLEPNTLSWGTVDTSQRIVLARNGSWVEPKHIWYTLQGATPAEMKSIETGQPLS